MEYLFNSFTFNTEKFELHADGNLVKLEPQVFLLLKHLIENRDRMISKDEIISEVWGGRIVTDASVASRIKFARAAIGDNGSAQHSIRTIHGKGFRFVADVMAKADNVLMPAKVLVPDKPPEQTVQNSKPSIAVLPFQALGNLTVGTTLSDAIPHDLIQAFARLRWLFVIARGSAFRFRTPDPDVREIGKALNVRYVLFGSVEMQGQLLVVTVELSDTGTGGVVWGDRFTAKADEVHGVREEITSKVVAALEIQIPLNEANSARLNISENLDSWSNYHLGLRHMYRFTLEDNSKATRLFEKAVAQDPHFARAYAGLSFTSFQSAFMKYKDGTEDPTLDARRFAERSIEIDPLDPFSNLTMGRSYWLQQDLERSTDWLDRSIVLSPNYSHGHYSHAFSDIMSARPENAMMHVETAFELSPLDPFLYAMFGVRALSYVVEGDYKNAAEWAEKAARAPGSHFLIAMIAVTANSLVENQKRAQFWVDNIRSRRPDANQKHFFASFPSANTGVRKKISDELNVYGF